MTDITKDELSEAELLFLSEVELLFLNSDREGDEGVTYIQEYKLRFEWEKRMGSLVYIVAGSPVDLAKKIGSDRPQTRDKSKSYCGPFRLVDKKEKAQEAPAKNAEDEPTEKGQPKPSSPRRGRPKKTGGK